MGTIKLFRFVFKSFTSPGELQAFANVEPEPWRHKYRFWFTFGSALLLNSTKIILDDGLVASEFPLLLYPSND